MPNPVEIAEITVNNTKYSSWTSVRVSRTAGQPVGTFDFVACEGDASSPNGVGGAVPSSVMAGIAKIKVGDAVTVTLAGHKVVDGFVITRDASLSATDHTVLLQGASKTFDVITGSPKPQEFRGYGISAIINSLIGQFPGVSYTPPSGDDSKPIQTFRSQFGETAFEAIERLGRMRGLIFTDDENGNLVGINLTKDNTAGAGSKLAEGVNILSIRASLTDQSVMSKVAVVGQRQGSDDGRAGTVSKDAAVATNPSARPGRDSYIVAEHPSDAQDLQVRANHEIARQFFTGVEVNVVVQGWFKPGSSDIWKVVEKTNIYSPSVFTSEDGKMDLFVRSVTYLQDSQNGTRTSLDLCLQNGLSNLPDNDENGLLPMSLGQQGAQPSFNSLNT